MQNIEMKTGFDMFEHTPTHIPDLDNKIVALLVLLLQKAIDTACIYSKHSGCNYVGAQHIILSLQYEAHEFLQRPELDDEFANCMKDIHDETENESENESENDSENESGDDSEDESEDESEDDNFKVSLCDCDVCTKCNHYESTWDEWLPEDPLLKGLKSAINNAKDKIRVEDV